MWWAPHKLYLYYLELYLPFSENVASSTQIKSWMYWHIIILFFFRICGDSTHQYINKIINSYLLVDSDAPSPNKGTPWASNPAILVQRMLLSVKNRSSFPTDIWINGFKLRPLWLALLLAFGYGWVYCLIHNRFFYVILS